ncbi:hypothetical protein HanRHA438_Chr01g0027871 [Helianthus annuus]|nr:hypothetical protein HanRHA438_Chr01g0027871 [Helianthus annuus]
MLFTCLQCSPYAAKAMSLPSKASLVRIFVTGLFANVMSWVFIISLNASTDEVTTTGTVPK